MVLGLPPADRQQEADVIFAEFTTVSGNSDQMSRAAFVGCVRQRYPGGLVHGRLAEACFTAFDMTGSGTIGLLEYLLFHAAILRYNHERDAQFMGLQRLRMATVTAIYDLNSDGVLEAAELRELVRDMCIGDSHTKVIVAELGATVGDGIDADALLSAVREGRFHAHHLSTSSLQVLTVPRPPPPVEHTGGGGGGGFSSLQEEAESPSKIFDFSNAAAAAYGRDEGSLLPSLLPSSPEPRRATGLAASGSLAVRTDGDDVHVEEPEAKKRKRSAAQHHSLHGSTLRFTPPPPAATSEGTGTANLCKIVTTEISKFAEPADPGTHRLLHALSNQPKRAREQ